MDSADTIRDYKAALVPLIVLLILLRVGMMWLTVEYSIEYMLRQILYTITWAAVAYFLSYCSMLESADLFEISELRYMKHIAYLAALACAVRVIVTVVCFWPLISYAVWPSAYNIVEIIVWGLLGTFFFCYARMRAKQERRRHRSHR